MQFKIFFIINNVHFSYTGEGRKYGHSKINHAIIKRLSGGLALYFEDMIINFQLYHKVTSLNISVFGLQSKHKVPRLNIQRKDFPFFQFYSKFYKYNL